MSILHAPALVIVDDIERFAASYPNPTGKPWNSRVDPDDEKGSYTVRTWNSNAYNEHLCWANFDIHQGEKSSQFSASICAPGHHSEKVKQHIINSLWATYGSE